MRPTAVAPTSGVPADATGRVEDFRPPAAPPARRRRHWGLWVVAGLLALVVLIAGYFWVTFAQVWALSHRDDPHPAGAIVVLGAAQYNGRPSPVLQARLDQGLALWHRSVAPFIVVTGGKRPGDRYTEATSGYDYLRAHGVPDTAILEEVQGSSTYESLAASARFLKLRSITSAVLVSDSYHNARLLAIAHEVGLKAYVSPSRDRLSHTTEFHQLLRETMALSVGRIIGFRRLDQHR